VKYYISTWKTSSGFYSYTAVRRISVNETDATKVWVTDPEQCEIVITDYTPCRTRWGALRYARKFLQGMVDDNRKAVYFSFLEINK
jgi:hypothetical protein